MKTRLAKFFLTLARMLGGQADRPVRPTAAMAEALLNARPLWSVPEARAVSSFLHSGAGMSFSRRLRAVAARVAIEGAKDRANTIHSAGVSAGWNECVQYMHSLASCQEAISRVSGEQDTRQRAASHVENGQTPEDEASLLARLSS